VPGALQGEPALTMAPSRPLARLSLLLVGLATEAAAAPAGARKRKSADEKKVPMPHHSFISPMEYSSLLDDWTVSGASIFERNRLLLHPGVPQLAGFAFNKWPILTADFEVLFHFRVAGERETTKVPKDQAIAFWYVAENVSSTYNETISIKAADWGAGLKSQGMTFAGAKATFDGFGVVLSLGGAGKKPSVSFVTNDGKRAMSMDVDVPSAKSKEMDFRNTLNAAQFKLRVTNNKIEGHIKQSPSLAWNECFAVENPVKSGGYIGFTAWSGTGSPDAVTSDLVSIVEVEVSNYDETVIGEEMKDVSMQIQEAYRQMLTDENRHFVDQKSQTEHLQRLLSMLSEHLATSKPEDDRMLAEIHGLTSRVDALGADCKMLQTEAHLLLGKDGVHSQSDGVTAMKQEIMGLRRALVKDTATQRQKLEAVHKNIAEVKTQHSKASSGMTFSVLAKQTDTLEKTVSSRGTQMSWMMFFMIVSVAGIGFLMYSRMYYYEKKHFI